MITKIPALPLHLRKTRTITEIIKDSFQYLSNEARTLLPPLALYSFSLLTVSIIISYYGTGGAPDLLRTILSVKNADKRDAVFMVLGLLTYLGSICTLTYVINKNILYNNSNQKNADTLPFGSDKNLFSDFGNYIVSFIIIYLIYYGLSFGLDYLGKSDLIFERDEQEFDMVNYYFESFVMAIPKILIYPMVFYFCFNSLYVSLRDNTGASDALKKVFDTSKNKMKKIWISGVMILIICYIGLSIINFPLRYLYFIFPANLMVAMIGIGITKLISFTLYLFISCACVFTLGSVEDENEGFYIQDKIKTLDD
jgi:hypothetical protein